MANENARITVQLIDKFSRGFGALGRGFKRIQNQVTKLGSQVRSLTSGFGALGTAVVGGVALRRGLQLAERQAQAEATLLAALQGQVEELDRIRQIARDLQGETIIGDEQFIEAAALLVNMGVSTERLDDALRATVNTSQALGLSLESAAKGIGLFSAGRAGELGERIPELAELARQGRLASDGIDLLIQKFDGAAEAIARTPFGQATQSLNLLGDQFEQQGNVFVEFQNIILEGLVEAFQRLNETLQSPEFEDILAVAKAITREVAKLAPEILAIVGALGLIQIGAFVAPTLIIAAKIAAIVGLVVILAPLIQEIFRGITDILGVTEQVEGFFGDLTSQVKEIFAAVADGRLTIEDIFDVAVTELKIIALRIRQFVLVPILSIFDVVRENGVKLLKFLLLTQPITLLGIALSNIVALIFRGLNAFAPTVLGFIDRIINSVRDALAELLNTFLPNLINAAVNRLPAIVRDQVKKVTDPLVRGFAVTGDAIQKGFTSNLEGGFEVVNDTVQETNDQINKFATDTLKGALDTVKQIGPTVRAQQDDIDDTIEGLRRAVSIRISGRQLRRREEQAAQDRRQRQQRQQEVARNLAAQQRLEDQFNALRERRDAASAQRRAEFEIAELERLNQLRLISFEDFIRRREEIETGVTNQQIAAVQAQVDATQAQIKAKREEQGATADVRLELTQLIRLQTRLNELTDQRTEKLNELNNIRRDQIQRIRADLQGVEQEISEAIQANNELAESGQISIEEALNRNKDLIAQFREEQQLAIESAVAAAGGQITGEELNALIADIEDIGDTLEAQRPKVQTFSEGFIDSIRQATAEVRTLGTVGAAVGSGLASSLTNNLTNAFVDIATGAKSAGEAFKEFAVGVLADIGRLLIRLAILRAVSGAFGIPGFAEGGVVPGPSGVTTDTVPAMLTPGEHVIQKPSVGYYGQRAMEAINQRLIPRELLRGFNKGGRVPGRATSYFQEGGPVRSVPSESGTQIPQGPALAVVAPSNEAAERFNAGGRNALLAFLEENAAQINGLLRSNA